MYELDDFWPNKDGMKNKQVVLATFSLHLYPGPDLVHCIDSNMTHLVCFPKVVDGIIPKDGMAIIS